MHQRVFSKSGDIKSTPGAHHDECGDIMSTPGGVQYTGGCHEYNGGYHDKYGRYHKFSKDVQYTGASIRIHSFWHPQVHS